MLFDQHKIDLVELFLTYINLHKAFFHQGYELLAIDTETEFNDINSQVEIRPLSIHSIRFSAR